MAEFRTRILNCTPSRNTASDWTFEDAAAADLTDMELPLPESRDLREPLWWGVDDQGETGSCVGWAAANSVLRWHFVKAGLLPDFERLSARYLWMAAKEVDEYTSFPTTFIEIAGTSIKTALDIVRKFGAVPESVLPFGEASLFQGRPNSFYALAARFKISSYFSLGTDPRKWREWIAFNGPILTRLNVDDTWYRATENKGRLEAYRADTAGGGHAVALVGYDREGFVVRNTWGERWGDHGFGYASDAYAREAFTELYGVVM
ncbi:C1 family peptidase [Desulfomicrobium escambiense]|uniref:C1 family peptidase n=1 Tax=Desulfomicrobium escambiense TaxID=29503 RepID=UPI0003FCB100|nr:C1 family peptidase [Desulfomicrobium escambiense]